MSGDIGTDGLTDAERDDIAEDYRRRAFDPPRTATPVDAVTEAWPREPYGDDPDRVAECCAFEGHQPWQTTGDKFHGVVQVCACGDRLYDLADKEIPK